MATTPLTPLKTKRIIISPPRASFVSRRPMGKDTCLWVCRLLKHMFSRPWSCFCQRMRIGMFCCCSFPPRRTCLRRCAWICTSMVLLCLVLSLTGKNTGDLFPLPWPEPPYDFSHHKCDQDILGRVDSFLDDLVGPMNVKWERFAKDKKLDPLNISLDKTFVVDNKAACMTICALMKFGWCNGLSLDLHGVTIVGLSSLKLDSMHADRCLMMKENDTCVHCSNSLGAFWEGVDMIVKPHASISIQADLKLSPRGLSATCKTINRKITTTNVWYGVAHCSTETHDAVADINLCGALCKPMVETKICLGCLKALSLTLNLSTIKCTFSREGGIPEVPEMVKIFKPSLMEHITRRLEYEVSQKLIHAINTMGTKMPHNCPPLLLPS